MIVEAVVLFCGVAVADLDGAIDWYERLFGRSADVVVNDDEAMWQVAAAGWLYLVRDPSGSGGALGAIAVADLEEALGELAARGIAVPPVTEVGEAGRKAELADPEGNRIALIEVTAG